MGAIKAFLLGIWEFRRSFTTNCGDFDQQYEQGRDFAHAATFRHYDH